MKRAVAIVAASLVLAGGSGFLTAAAISQGDDRPTKTVTVTLTDGKDGPPGPPGPKGDPGDPSGLHCLEGYTLSDLVLNTPGGQVTILTCIKD